MIGHRNVEARLGLLWLLTLSLLVCTRVGRAQITPPFTTLYTFSALSNGSNGTNSDGGAPNAGLIQGKDGLLYGSTYSGGPDGDGTIFRITTSGALTTLHAFSGSDGSSPDGMLLQAADGNLYGTTYLGGSGSSGTVFKMTTSGALTTLCSFNYTDGAYPIGALIQGTDGNLYGTTGGGGTDLYGVVFKMTTTGTMTSLGSFSGSNGAGPNGLIQGRNGNLYGTCNFGGTGTYPGYGTVFQITPSDTLGFVGFTGTDGSEPFDSPILAKDGKLYGTTDSGGAFGQGTVFKSTTAGVLTRLYSFSALPSGYPFSNPDGAQPTSGLIQGKDGALYGTTNYGGANGWGTIFRITTAGILTTLYSFSAPTINNNADGLYPKSLLQGRDGNLYGVATTGGLNNAGTVFKLTMTPIVTGFSPTSGPVGATVTVSGANFTEVTAVKIGSVAAKFTTQSDTSLTLVVPTSAKTGRILVSNPFGNGSSKTTFKVTP